uniref:Immunoglobulin domain-containing protein n=1 Tax=Geospiza parvula TaxID=87175 RepID=A0A8U8BM99_GEOPR
WLKQCLLILNTIPACQRPKFLSGTVGGSVSFRCHHDPQGTYERKYLCRWRAGSCQVLLDTEGFVLESHRGRAQMSSSSTVLLGQLREEDAGWYWCGARKLTVVPGKGRALAVLCLLRRYRTTPRGQSGFLGRGCELQIGAEPGWVRQGGHSGSSPLDITKTQLSQSLFIHF